METTLNGSIFASVTFVGTEHGTLFFSQSDKRNAEYDRNRYRSDLPNPWLDVEQPLRSGLRSEGGNIPAKLYNINPLTGAATLVGALGSGIPNYFALSTNSISLYFAFDNSLYTLRTSTGGCHAG
jgi:hypothetical protein